MEWGGTREGGLRVREREEEKVEGSEREEEEGRQGGDMNEGIGSERGNWKEGEVGEDERGGRKRGKWKGGRGWGR